MAGSLRPGARQPPALSLQTGTAPPPEPGLPPCTPAPRLPGGQHRRLRSARLCGCWPDWGREAPRRTRNSRVRPCLGCFFNGEVARGKERCVRVFLEHGADPTVKDLIGGFTALHYAAMHGRARIARLMLESEYRSDIINAKSNDGWTPLHVAAHYGRDSFVRLLLEFKAEVDPLSDKGTTPLQLAIIRERSSCVKILLDHNANIDIQNGFLLRYAVIKSNHSYCRMFLQRGADTNLGRLEDGQTPLHLSALRDDVLCARMLYNYGADTNTRNYEGQTPLAVSISISGSSRPCLDFLQEVTRQPRNLQDLCRIKIRQCIGLQNLKLLDELPIAKVMKDYLKHKFDDI
uniref:Ankyrin repeat and SOCS box protein 7 n=1 Tax=Sus scrofa TaxID=9823 RepID=A0A8D0PY65_PIG